MKTWKRALALVLALVMALSLVALPSFAEGEETGGDTGMPYIKDQGGTVEQNGLVMSKTIKKGEDGQFLLTLEAYATGSTTTTTSTKPVDIVLVLDQSGSMAYDFNGESTNTNANRRQYAMKQAVNNFIDAVSEKYADEADHRIAIVTFGSNASVLKDWTYVDSDGKGQLKSSITDLPQSPSGATNAGAGMQQAQTLMGSGYNYTGTNTQRQKAVVMFTDGVPTTSNVFNIDVANSAIAAAKAMKDDGTVVYTVGIFNGANPSEMYGANGFDTNSNGTVGSKWVKDTWGFLPGTDFPEADRPAGNRFLNLLSSNFQGASEIGLSRATDGLGVLHYKITYTITKNFDRTADSYYLNADDAASLNNIFQTISQTIGSTPVKLTSTSVLRDVISDSFKLPAGADKSSIKAYSVDCLDKNSDGSYSWQDKSAWTAISPENIELTDNNKTINVTGFDYAANWVDQFGVNDSQSHGKKLVVQIPIVPETTAYGDCDTNGPASGIYATGVDGEEPVKTFPSPVVYIPYFTVVHVASTVNDQGHNEGKRTGETHHPVWCNRPFNLTSVVTENYLYGGTFNEETCTTVHKDVQEQGNPMELNPTENATYYIWEVPDTYLRPFAFWVSRHLEGGNGTQNVTQMYLLSLLDRVNYLDAGLYVQFAGDEKGEYISSGCEQLTGKTDVNKEATVYQMLEYALCTAPDNILETWYLVDGKVTTFDGELQRNADGRYLDGTNSAARVIDDGCIIGHRLDSDEFAKFQDHSVTYRPYWITQDGVRVEGLRDRTYTFAKDSDRPTKGTVNSYETKDAYEFVGTGTQAVQTLALRTNMLTAESEPAVENVTVTVVDAAKTYELTVSAGTGIRDQVAYQAPAGKVFAGWFADQAYTTPADLDQVTQDTTIYAKYVSDSYLDLDYSRIGLFRLRGVTLISAVDNPANYQASGFIVGDQKVDASYASRYRIFKTPANLFGAARDAKLMLADKSLSGTGDLEVTPYWITLDGTEVHGVTHTLHYNTRTIWE